MKHTLSLLFAALVCLFTACEHKPLLLPPSSANVNVIFDWSDVDPDEKPETVDLHFYTEDGTTVDRTVPTDKDEQDVVIEPNVYRLLVTAGSEDVTTTTPGSIATHTMTLMENPLGVVGHILGDTNAQYQEPVDYDKPLGYALDPVFAYVIERVEVSGTQKTTIVVKPRRVSARYNIYVHDIKFDPASIKLFGGALSGLNGTLLPGQTLSDVKCVPADPSLVMSEPFAFDWKGEEVATTKLYTFGTPDSEQAQNLYLYIWSGETGLLALKYDVTDQILAAEDPMNVDIHVGNVGTGDNAGGGLNVNDYEDGGNTDLIM